MPEYTKVIAVDGTDFNHILQTFSGLVHDKFHKPIPYRDYTQLRKHQGEVEFRFSSNDGAVMAVPTESGKSLLWWGKKDDESFGTFLWDYFQEELKEMHPEENKKIENTYKYDLWGSYDSSVDAACTASAKGVIDDICSTHSWSLSSKTDNNSTCATIAGDYHINTAIPINGWTDVSDTVEKLKARVEELGKMVKDDTAELHEQVQEIARTSIKSLEEAYEEMEAKLAKKVDISEMEYHLEDRMMDVYAEIDESRYDTKELRDRICELEDNLCPKQKEETVLGTSSNYYPVKNYTIKADYMSASDNRKEKKNMDTNKMFNGFEFGPVDDRIKMSPYGMAIRNADGRYVSYDAKSGNIVDVEVFNFDNHNLIYKMPVAVSAIAVGDTVIHMKKPMFVTNVTNGITAIDIFNGEIKTIMPATNMFGFNFVTKVVSLFNFTGANAPTAENPFGNILPFMLMNEGGDFKDMLPLMLMMNGNGMDNFMQNPLMMYMLMKDSDGVGDVLPFLMLGQPGLFGQAPAHTCNCGKQPDGENHQ